MPPGKQQIRTPETFQKLKSADGNNDIKYGNSAFTLNLRWDSNLTCRQFGVRRI